MGSELPPSTTYVVELFVEGTAPLRKVEIVRARGATTPLPFKGSSLRSRIAISRDRPGSIDYAYVRVEQVDDEVAWSSPLWLSP